MDDYDTQHALDIRVALAVMGWTRYVSADHTNSKNAFLRKVGIVYGYRDRDGRSVGLDVPPWSTDIAVAWRVVEHMRKNVPDYRALRMESVPLGYTVAFYSHKKRLDRAGAFVAAETAPLAICLAALKAVEAE